MEVPGLKASLLSAELVIRIIEVKLEMFREFFKPEHKFALLFKRHGQLSVERFPCVTLWWVVVLPSCESPWAIGVGRKSRLGNVNELHQRIEKMKL